MESIEFLGGKYDGLEQITLGPTQAFRARNGATGRSVFIHRVSTTEAPAEQAALLKLLTTALVKSGEAKRLVLDFGEDSGFWYVVTESEPQCALLRDWLQVQVDSVAANARPVSAAPPVSPSLPATAQKPLVATERMAAPKPSMVAEPATAAKPPLIPESDPPTGLRVPAIKPVAEAAQSTSHPEANMGDFTRMFAKTEPEAPVPKREPEAPAQKMEPASQPGEFTGFFSSAKPHVPEPQSAPPPPPPQESRLETPLIKQEQEPGEFTRLFRATPDPLEPRPPAVTPSSAPPRPLNSGQVQRPMRGNVGVPPTAPPPPPPVAVTPRVPTTPIPATPVAPPPAPRSSGAQESGEFTKFFSTPTHLGRETPVRSENLFNDRIDIPQPLPPSKPAEGDFTRMFGTEGPAAPPPATPIAVAKQTPKSILDEPNPLNTQPIQAFHPTPPKANLEEAPSEFTRIARSGFAASKPSVPSPDIKVSVPNVAIPTPPVPAAAPAKSNKNLVIFLAVLAVLAVLLILAFVFLMKK